MELLDRFAILRQALPLDRYADDEVAQIADRCCELDLVPGAVVATAGQSFEDWLVVVSGQLEVRDEHRRWIAGGGAIVQPCGVDHPGIAIASLAALTAATILLVTGTGGRHAT